MSRLLAPRLIAWHLLVLSIAAAFVWLGFWQLGRHGDLQERNALLGERLASTPQPYRELTASLDPDAPEGADGDARHRPVVVEGRFLPEHEVLLRGRTLDELPGFHVLTPLLIQGEADASGRAVLVDRGWIPFRYDEPDVPSWSPPEGPVLILGRLQPEADRPVGPLAAFAPRDPPDGELTTVARADVERLQPQIPVPLDPYLVEAAGIEVLAATEGLEPILPRLPPPPGPEAGPHFAYALQWFFFAGIAVVGYALLLRRRMSDEGGRTAASSG